MPVDDGLGNRQPEAGAVGTPGYHGRKNRVDHVFRNTRSVVDDVHPADQSMPLGAHRELPLGPGAQGDLALLGVQSGLQRVAHDVQHRLDQLGPVGGKFWQARVVIPQDDRPVIRFRCNQVAHVLEHFMNIERLPVQLLVGAQQAVHQVAQAICLADNDPGVFCQALVR